MPETFPIADDATGTLTEVVHYSADELADMFHMHTSTLSRLMRRDRWPHLAVGKRAWFTEADIAAALSIMRQNDGAYVPPEDEAEPGRLGIVVPPSEHDDTEPV